MPKPDYQAVGGILFAFFSVLFIYVLIETLLVPLLMDQYAWTENKAMIVVGIMMSAGAVISIGMFTGGAYLAKKYDERKVLLVIGMVPIVIGTFLLIPFGHKSIKMQECVDLNETTPVPTTTEFTEPDSALWDVTQVSLGTSAQTEPSESCSLGCPTSQEWCKTVPQLAGAQLAIGFGFITIGYPVVISLLQAVFSKVLGSKPQGVWQGILTGVGSLSRILGPLLMSYVYALFGTRWSFGIMAVLMVVTLLELIVLFPHLIPMQTPTTEQQSVLNGPAAKKY